MVTSMAQLAWMADSLAHAQRWPCARGGAVLGKEPLQLGTSVVAGASACLMGQREKDRKWKKEQRAPL